MFFHYSQNNPCITPYTYTKIPSIYTLYIYTPYNIPFYIYPISIPSCFFYNPSIIPINTLLEYSEAVLVSVIRSCHHCRLLLPAAYMGFGFRVYGFRVEVLPCLTLQKQNLWAHEWLRSRVEQGSRVARIASSFEVS